MFKKILFIVLSVSLGIVSTTQPSYGESPTTKVEATNAQIYTTPRRVKYLKSVNATTIPIPNTTVSTTPKVQTREVLNEDALKKISSTLCTKGFKAYVGTTKRNVCQSKASSPDFAYSCVWKKKGPVAYAPTAQGPCNLDYTEHRGNVIIKDQPASYPPFSYGVEGRFNPPRSYGFEAQCCYRAAVGSMI